MHSSYCCLLNVVNNILVCYVWGVSRGYYIWVNNFQMNRKRIGLVVIVILAVSAQITMFSSSFLNNILFPGVVVIYGIYVLMTGEKLGLADLMLLPVLYIGLEPLVDGFSSNSYESDIVFSKWEFVDEGYNPQVRFHIENIGDKDISSLRYTARMSSDAESMDVSQSGVILDFKSETKKGEFVRVEDQFIPDDVVFEIEEITFE